MKTPKRQKANLSDYATNIHYHDARARWRRKNRVKQLKHTIARLNRELAIFIEPENFALICDALVTHAASSSDRTTELRCLHLLTTLARPY